MKKTKKLLMVVSVLAFNYSFGQTAQSTTQAVVSVQPKIMVIPFTKEGEDIRTVLEADVNRRVAVTKTKESFDNRGFTTVDFTAKLKSAMDNQMFTSGTQSDIKSQLIDMSGADIYVEVEVPSMIITNNGNKARLILTAYDCSTGNSLSNKVCESNEFNTTDYGGLVENAIKKCLDDFLNTMQSKFSDIVANGRSVAVQFNVASASKYKLSTIIQPDGLPLSDVLETWMGDNSYKNNYHIQGTTETRMMFDDVHIPLKDDNGRNYNPNKFALKIFQFLKSKQITCIKDIKNGTIFITIN